MASDPKKFGKYYLLDPLAKGGMAEISRARLASTDGAGRILVIKRIQGNFGESQDFLQMFQSEIKVTLGFNHPNIVQLYDFGEEHGQPYIAMEWIDGRNLRQLINRFAEFKKPFPVELAAYITEQAAAGLQYAHAYRDKITGEHLNIVHRDISPQNILVSFEGTVKVIDFGIAKAATNSESTRAGVIKGKPSYLSPEQISGEVLDGRSDLFALGAVLWETLTGKKLFAADSDLAVLKLIEGCSTHVKPPSIHNPAVPKELDEIVLKSLARSRDKRFANCEEFSRTLHKFIYSTYGDFNPGDLATQARELFKEEIVEDRKKIQKLNAEAELSLQMIQDSDDDSSEEEEEDDSSKKKSKKEPDRNGAERPMEFEFNGEDIAEKSAAIVLENLPRKSGHSPSSSAPIHHSPSSQAKSSSRPASTPHSATSQTPPSIHRPSSAAGTRTVPLHQTGSISRPGMRKPSPSPSSSPKVKIDPKLAVILGVIGVATVVVSLGGNDLLSSLSPPPPQRETSAAPKPVQPGPGTEPARALGDKMVLLRLQISPGGGSPSVLINGKALRAGETEIPVPVDSPLEIVVNRPGFKPYQNQLVIDSKQLNGLKEWPIDVGIEPLHYGFLTLHSTPNAKASIPIDESIWTKQTPLDAQKMPVGSYQIKLENDVLGMSKIISVTIEEGKTASIDERLDIKK